MRFVCWSKTEYVTTRYTHLFIKLCKNYNVIKLADIKNLVAARQDTQIRMIMKKEGRFRERGSSMYDACGMVMTTDQCQPV